MDNFIRSAYDGGFVTGVDKNPIKQEAGMSDKATQGLGIVLTLIIMAIFAPVVLDLGRWITEQIFKTGAGYTGGITLASLILGYFIVSHAIGNVIAAALT